MSTWDALKMELDQWQEAGRTAHFWWRDDDAVEPTPALEHLLRLASDHRAPVALAVIPAAAQESLAVHLNSANEVSVLIHGYAHVNHAASGEKKSEYPASRPVEVMEHEISAGFGRLREFFGALAAPVFVPPWNRVAPEVIARLPHLGLTGLSSFGPRGSRLAAPGLVRVNTHVDPVDWHRSRSYAGDEAVLAAAVAHLRTRRAGGCDDEEPTPDSRRKPVVFHRPVRRRDL
jgi:hypothetical protein